MESGQQQFGMMLSQELECGTMLHIKSFTQLPDGRSKLDTVGERRFRVLNWGTKDGYAVAEVSFIEDAAEEESEEINKMYQLLRDTCMRCIQGRGLQYRQYVTSMLGWVPENNEELVYWAVAANVPNTPLSPEEQYDIVFGTEERRVSAQARLHRLLELVTSNSNEQ